MKRFLQRLDSFFHRSVSVFLGVSMFLLMCITFLQVIARYFLKVSIGGLEELPVYLMVASVWFAASMLCAENGHITLDILDLVVKNKRVLTVVNLLLDLLTVGALCFFGTCMYRYLLEGISAGTISPGLKFPLWWMTLIMLVNILLMALYTFKNFITGLRGLKNGNFD